MKRGLIISLLALLLALAGCGGVSREEYDRVCAERDALQARLEVAPELEIGGTYVFELEPREDLEITAEEYEGGAPFADEAISRYGLRIAGFRAAREDEFGLDSSCIVFEKRD